MAERDGNRQEEHMAVMGFDREAAVGRVRSHPEVMPPHPEPYRPSPWRSMELWGLRPLPLLGVATAGLVLAWVVARAPQRTAARAFGKIRGFSRVLPMMG